MSALMAIIAADMRLRSRQPSFVVTLAALLLLTALLVPPSTAPYATMVLTDPVARPRYTAAHVGATTAVLTTIIITLLGFFLVFGSIERDRRTGVGQILAATRLTRHAYVFGKLIGGTLYLCVPVALMAVMTLLLQVARGEGPFDAAPILWAYLVLPLPAAVAVAGMALAVDAAGIRAGFAVTASYLLLWLAAMSAASLSFITGRSHGFDLSGLGLIVEAIGQRGLQFGIVPAAPGTPTFTWPGLPVDSALAASRAVWVAVGVVFAGIGAWVFERFDPTRPERGAPSPVRSDDPRDSGYPVSAAAPLSRLDVVNRPARLDPGILMQDVRLALARRRWYWPACVAVAVLALLLPASAVHRIVGVIAAVIVLPVVADLAVQDSRSGVADLVFSAPLARRAYVWRKTAVALAIVAMAGAGPAVRLAFAQPEAALWLLSGLTFTAAWAVAAGALVTDERLFLVSMLLLWYGSGLNEVPPFIDYAGFQLTAGAAATPVRALYPIAGFVALVGADAAVRRRESR